MSQQQYNERHYIDTAKAIIKGIGGKENLQSVSHCATRLRLVLVDENKIQQTVIDKIEMVKGSFATANQLQLIVGTGMVDKVYAELAKLANAAPSAVKEPSVKQSSIKQSAVKKEDTAPTNQTDKLMGGGNLFLHPFKTLADIFMPIIPVIVATGLLLALYNLLTTKGLFYVNMSVVQAVPEISSIAHLVEIFASVPYTLLPVLIGFSATRVFGGNAILGAVLGMLMIHPDVMSLYAYAQGAEVHSGHLFDLTIEKVGFQGTILPVVIMSWVLAKFETAFSKLVPVSLNSLITPILALAITVLITFTLTGPLLREGGVLLAYNLQMLYQTYNPEGGAVFGFLYAPIMITGMHQLFPTVELKLLADIAKTGGSFILPVAVMSSMAQGGATFGAFFTTKNKSLKGVSLAGSTSAILGVSEPAIFGVNLRLGYPFYAALVATAIASAFIAFTGVLAISAGTSTGLQSILSINLKQWLPYAYAMSLAFFSAFILTLLLAKTRLNGERNKAKVQTTAPSTSKETEKATSAKKATTQAKTESKTETKPVSKAQTTEPTKPVTTAETVTTKQAQPNANANNNANNSTNNNAELLTATTATSGSVAAQKIKSHILQVKENEAESTEKTEKATMAKTETTEVAKKTTETVAESKPADNSTAKQNSIQDVIKESLSEKTNTVKPNTEKSNDVKTNDVKKATKKTDVEKAEDFKQSVVKAVKNEKASASELVDKTSTQSNNKTTPVTNGDWVMPLAGKVIALKDVPNPTFASGAMGAGFAIKPIIANADSKEKSSKEKASKKIVGKVVSPVAGTVSAIFPSKHAVCIETADGVEILIHVGIDTVALNGEGFTALIEEGANVQVGTPLLEVDWQAIKAKVPSLITPILFTSLDEGQQVEIKDGKPVLVG